MSSGLEYLYIIIRDPLQHYDGIGHNLFTIACQPKLMCCLSISRSAFIRRYQQGRSGFCPFIVTLWDTGTAKPHLFAFWACIELLVQETIQPVNQVCKIDVKCPLS